MPFVPFVLRDQEPFLYVCSLSRTDFVGECVEDFAADFVGDLRGEEGEDDVLLLLFSLVSGSIFFLGDEDLVKRPISVKWRRVGATRWKGRFSCPQGDPCSKLGLYLL